MNKKIFVSFLIVFSVLLLAHAANAIDPITAWTDKPRYNLGEKGTIHIAFLNTRDFGVKVENLTVTYKSWQAYKDGNWIGNETHTIGVNVGKGNVYLIDVTFTVPNDGRAKGECNVDVRIGTDYGYETKPNVVSIEVSETPTYMEQIVTLFTIQVVLIIVCTVIMAATIFLSARRPQVTWKSEEK